MSLKTSQLRLSTIPFFKRPLWIKSVLRKAWISGPLHTHITIRDKFGSLPSAVQFISLDSGNGRHTIETVYQCVFTDLFTSAEEFYLHRQSADEITQEERTYINKHSALLEFPTLGAYSWLQLDARSETIQIVVAGITQMRTRLQVLNLGPLSHLWSWKRKVVLSTEQNSQQMLKNLRDDSRLVGRAVMRPKERAIEIKVIVQRMM